MSDSINRRSPDRPRSLRPTVLPDLLPVEDLRSRAVLARAPMSPAVAAAVAALAFGSIPETWRARA